MAEINEIFSSEVIKQMIQFAELADKANRELSELKNTTNDIAEQAQKFATVQADVNRISKEQAETTQKATRQAATYAEALEKEAKTLAELNLQNKALRDARAKVDTTTKEGAKRIKEINKQLDENNKKIKENSSNLEQQKINVGNYISSWGPFQGIATMVTRGIGIMKIAFVTLKAAIISTGIGALVVLLGSLYTYFTRTGEGADKLARFMAQVRAVVDVLIDRFAQFGEGLIKIFSGDFREGAELISNSFKGIGKELKEEVKTAGQLADKLDELDKRARTERVTIAKNNLEKEKALGIARSETSTLEEKEAAIKRAMALARENNALIVGYADDELKALQDQAKMRTLNDEELNKLADLEIAALEKKAAAQGEINSLLKLQNKIMGEVAEAQEINASRTLEIGKMQFIDAELIKTEAYKKELELREVEHIDFIKREDERLKAQQENRLKTAQFYVGAIANLGNALLEINAIQLDNQTKRMEQSKAYELKLAGDNQEKIASINDKYAKQERALKVKAAKQNKAAAIFNAVIGTAQAVISGLATMPFVPLGIIMGALAGVLGGIQIGLISAQPIPAFAKGTRKAPRGMAWVGERGRELIAGPGGLALSPGTASLVNLGKGGQRIYNNRETEMILRAAKGADTPEIRQLMNQLKSDNDRLIDTIKNKKELHIYDSGRRIVERGNGFSRTYFDKKITG